MVGIKRGEICLILIVIVVLLSSCEESINDEEPMSNEITGQAIAAEILRACKYPDGKFCEENCCRAEEKCEDGSIAYMECDLKSGEWTEKTYADSKCSSECDIVKFSEEIEENKPEKSCIEGWKCLNKFERIYRKADCSFGETERCSTMCVNDTCSNLCAPETFSCKNEVLRKCDEDGMDWRYYTTCDYGCQNNTCVTSLNQTQNTTVNICGNSCFSITNFHYDAEGNDNNNENDEYVTIKNSCLFSCDLTGWEISDNSSHDYSFASFNLVTGNSFTLYTGEGADTESKLYWGRGSAVWNNDGDILYLKNSNNEMIFNYTY